MTQTVDEIIAAQEAALHDFDAMRRIADHWRGLCFERDEKTAPLQAENARLRAALDAAWIAGRDAAVAVAVRCAEQPSTGREEHDAGWDNSARCIADSVKRQKPPARCAECTCGGGKPTCTKEDEA